MEWITRPDPEYEVPNIDWIIKLFLGRKKDDRNLEPRIKSWTKPVCALKDLLKERCNIEGTLVFCPYRWPNRLK